MNQTPPQLLATLKQEQDKNPKLNLQGLTLPEYLFFDAYQFSQTGCHLDEQGWEYLVAETVLNTGRALIARWDPDDRQVVVYAFFDAYSDLGARFAACSHSPS